MNAWPRRERRSIDPKCDPNVIIGPVCPAHVWKGSPDNLVRNGWSFEIYTRIDGIVDSYFPRVARTERTSARWRRELIKAHLAIYPDCSTFHVCASDAELLTTIRRVWGIADDPLT
jgi:hypothetical protein